MARAVKKVDTEDLGSDLEITTKEKTRRVMGRPKKFKKELTIKLNLPLTDGQAQAIDEIRNKKGYTVRLDYIRSLLRADIPNFDDL